MDPVLDPETGLQYLRARYYDPGTGQFLTRDPAEALTREPYAYAGDNPLSFTDPSGLDIFDDIGSVASTVGNFVAHNWRPIASAGATVATTVGCGVQPEACGIFVGANTAFQSAVVATGPGSVASKAGLIAVNLLSAGAASGGAGASLILREEVASGQSIPGWVEPFVTATGSAPWLALTAAQLATYPWVTC